MTPSRAAPPRPWAFGPVPVLALCTGLCFAAHGRSDRMPEPVRFAPGASSAEVRGAVVRGGRALHSVQARAGQRMSLRISAVEGNAVFQLYPPGAWPGAEGIGGRALPGAGEGADTTRWAGVLPRSGAYLVVVGPTRGNAAYRLTVQLR